MILLVVVTFGVWVYYRGSRPMDIPEARGITFWQFIRERWHAWEKTNNKIKELPQYAGCRNDITHYLGLNLRGSYNFAYASLFPESKVADAFHYWEVHKPDPVLPKVEPIAWHQAMDAFWQYFSRAYWRALVTIDAKAGVCQWGPVDFSSILGESL